MKVCAGAICQKPAVRALAEVLGSNLPDNYRMLAGGLIYAVPPTLAELKSLRAQAYMILACGCLMDRACHEHQVA